MYTGLPTSLPTYTRSRYHMGLPPCFDRDTTSSPLTRPRCRQPDGNVNRVSTEDPELSHGSAAPLARRGISA